MMFGIVAPCTFRTPISIVRCAVVKALKPNNPSSDIKMHIHDKPEGNYRLVSVAIWSVEGREN